jgi:hypothetical protein
MGVGVVVRDHLGTVKATMCLVVPFVAEPITAEALGARQAADFGRYLGYQSMQL